MPTYGVLIILKSSPNRNVRNGFNFFFVKQRSQDRKIPFAILPVNEVRDNINGANWGFGRIDSETRKKRNPGIFLDINSTTRFNLPS